MTIYRARVVHGRTGAEGDYRFEGPEDLMSQSAVKVMAHFMAHVAAHRLIEHEDYESFAALKDREHDVVTVIGDYHYTADSRSPFMTMIARAD